MSTFKQAIKWLEEGKKIRRLKWEKYSYWILGHDQTIKFIGITNAHVHLNQINADDWEIYKESKKENDWSCIKCGKEYKTYLVILDDNPLSISRELDVREKYYNQKSKKGLCETCSKKIRR